MIIQYLKRIVNLICGSHQCGSNTVQGLTEYTLNNGQTVWAVHLDYHGPNIVFSKNTDPKALIEFINTHWSLSEKTTGLEYYLI